MRFHNSKNNFERNLAAGSSYFATNFRSHISSLNVLLPCDIDQLVLTKICKLRVRFS